MVRTKRLALPKAGIEVDSKPLWTFFTRKHQQVFSPDRPDAKKPCLISVKSPKETKVKKCLDGPSASQIVSPRVSQRRKADRIRKQRQRAALRQSFFSYDDIRLVPRTVETLNDMSPEDILDVGSCFVGKGCLKLRIAEYGARLKTVFSQFRSGGNNNVSYYHQEALLPCGKKRVLVKATNTGEQRRRGKSEFEPLMFVWKIFEIKVEPIDAEAAAQLRKKQTASPFSSTFLSNIIVHKIIKDGNFSKPPSFDTCVKILKQYELNKLSKSTTQTVRKKAIQKVFGNEEENAIKVEILSDLLRKFGFGVRVKTLSKSEMMEVYTSSKGGSSSSLIKKEGDYCPSSLSSCAEDTKFIVSIGFSPKFGEGNLRTESLLNVFYTKELSKSVKFRTWSTCGYSANRESTTLCHFVSLPTASSEELCSDHFKLLCETHPNINHPGKIMLQETDFKITKMRYKFKFQVFSDFNWLMPNSTSELAKNAEKEKTVKIEEPRSSEKALKKELLGISRKNKLSDSKLEIEEKPSRPKVFLEPRDDNTSFCEYFSKAFGLRHEPQLCDAANRKDLFLEFFHIFCKTKQRHLKKRKESFACDSRYTPETEKLLEDIKCRAKLFKTVQVLGNDQIKEIMLLDGDSPYKVSFDTNTKNIRCSCMETSISGFPCSHTVRAAQFWNLRIEDFLDSSFATSTWKNQFRHEWPIEIFAILNLALQARKSQSRVKRLKIGSFTP